MRKAGSGKREAGSGVAKSAGLVEATPFAERMRAQGMAAPSALADSMRRAMAGENVAAGEDARGNEDDAAGEGSAEDTLRAAERLLDRVLAGECESRDSALDLLTVDALVTRAMEIAARDPDSLAEFPESAMKRISTR